MDTKETRVGQDPRLTHIDDGFRGLIAGIGKAFGGLAKAKGARATHTVGVAARGSLQVLSRPDLPPHRHFHPGARYPVLVRHANIKGGPDDAVRDGRGLTLRILRGDPDAATADLDLDAWLVDVLTSTGRCFFLANAADFARWVASDMDGRAAMLTEFPRIRPIFEEIVKNPDSYTQLHYYSEVTYHFLAEDGTSWYMRYRILNADKSADTGAVPPETVCLPEDTIPRPADDTRSQTYLRDDFHERVAAGNGVYYMLQMQLRPVSVLAADNETARDCTLPWDEGDYPFRDVAIIHLHEPLAHDVVEPLAFSPYHAPPQLGLILARHAGEAASINHLRSVVYDVSAAMRNGTPLPPGLAALFS